jgi:hypothetical protein
MKHGKIAPFINVSDAMLSATAIVCADVVYQH